VTIQPSLVVTYNEAVYIGPPVGDMYAPRPSLSRPPLGANLGFRAEAVVPVTDTWALTVRYVPLWTPSLITDRPKMFCITACFVVEWYCAGGE
jgi:hypothetical protein